MVWIVEFLVSADVEDVSCLQAFLLLLSTDSFHTTPPLAHTLLQPSCSIQTGIQLHQTSVLMSEGHKGICFYFSLEPLPPEHLTRFHTSSHLQSLTETQSSCLSSIIQNNLMSDYLPPFMCVQFLPTNPRASISVSQQSLLFSVCVWGELAQFEEKHVDPVHGQSHSPRRAKDSESGSFSFRHTLVVLSFCKCHENRMGSTCSQNKFRVSL